MLYCYSTKSKLISMEAMLLTYDSSKSFDVYNWKPKICFIEQRRGRWDVYYDRESVIAQQKICEDLFFEHRFFEELIKTMERSVEYADTLSIGCLQDQQTLTDDVINSYLAALTNILNYYSFTNNFLFESIEKRIINSKSLGIDAQEIKKQLFWDSGFQDTKSFRAYEEIQRLKFLWRESNEVYRPIVEEVAKKYGFLFEKSTSSPVDYLDAIIRTSAMPAEMVAVEKHMALPFAEQNCNDCIIMLKHLRLLRLKMREAMMQLNFYFSQLLNNDIKCRYSNYLSEREMKRLINRLPIEALYHLDQLKVDTLLNSENVSEICINGQPHIINRLNYVQIEPKNYGKVNKVQGTVVYGSGEIVGEIYTCYYDNLKEHQEGKIYVTKSLHPKDLLVADRFAAVIVDEGGILSHASIMAQELKIPCIIGAQCLSSTLNEGDRIRVDFSTGSIEQLPSKEVAIEKSLLVNLSPQITNADLYGNKCTNLCAYMGRVNVVPGLAFDCATFKTLYTKWKNEQKICLSDADVNSIENLFPVILRSSSSYEDSDNYTGAGLLESVRRIHNIEEFMEAVIQVYESSETKAVENYQKFVDNNMIGMVAAFVQKYYDFDFFGTILINNKKIEIEYRQRKDSSFKYVYLEVGNDDEILQHPHANDIEKICIPEIKKIYNANQHELIEFGIEMGLMYVLQVRTFGGKNDV